jgi:hypothetical protein
MRQSSRRDEVECIIKKAEMQNSCKATEDEVDDDCDNERKSKIMDEELMNESAD